MSTRSGMKARRSMNAAAARPGTYRYMFGVSNSGERGLRSTHKASSASTPNVT